MRHRVSFFLTVFLLVSHTVRAQLPARPSEGERHFNAGEWAAARMQFEAALRRDPRDAGAHYYLGRLALLSNDPESAAESLEQATTLDPRSATYAFWYGRALTALVPRVPIWKRPAMVPKVRETFERAVALDPASLDARDALVDIYAMAPAVMGGGMDKARSQAASIASIDRYRGQLANARLSIRAKDSAAAARAHTSAVELAPDSARAYVLLATWHGDDKRWASAFDAVDQLLRRRPRDPQGLFAYGRIAAESGQNLDKGGRLLRSYLARPPIDVGPATLARAHVLLARVLAHAGRPAESREEYARAAQLDPRNEEAASHR